jgi:peptide deformylase
MAINRVLRMGDARLLRRADPVIHFGSNELLALITDMRDTMQATNGVGLAAPQIGVNLRVVIFGTAPIQQARDKKNPRYPDADEIPETVLINPIITVVGDNIEGDWEGCLSLPGLRGLVPRHQQIRYQGFNEKGEGLDRTVSGFHARVVQHECDHLDGILYPMRMKDFNKFGYNEELFPGKVLQDE